MIQGDPSEKPHSDALADASCSPLSQTNQVYLQTQINVQDGDKVKIPNQVPSTSNNPAQIKQRYGNHRNKTTKGFQRADFLLALKDMEKQTNRFYKGQQITCNPRQDHFYIYSPGIFLFFSFLKRSSILFFVLSLIYTIPLLYNYFNGHAFDNIGKTFQASVAKTMLGNQINTKNNYESLQDKLVIFLTDSISTIIFFGFYIYWDSYTAKKSCQYKEKFKRISDKTIQITEFSADITSEYISQEFSKYGVIQEIAQVKNYEQMIDLSKQIYQLCLQIKEQNLLRESQLGNTGILELNKKQKRVNELFQQLQKIQQKREKKNIKFYVRFKNISSKLEILRQHKQRTFLSLLFNNQISPQQSINQRALMKVSSCQTEPAEIIWENIHISKKSRVFRFLVQFIFIIFILSAGFLLISAINISTPPTSYSNIQTDNLTLEEVKKSNSFSIEYTWCMNRELKNEEQINLCYEFQRSYFYRLLFSVIITIVILIIKSTLKIIMISVARFQRYKNHTELSTNVMTNLFLIYFGTTIMITFLMQANIFGVSFKKFISYFISNESLKDNLDSFLEYSDFDHYWYKDIGYQIWLNWIVMSIFPHIFMPLYLSVKQRIKIWMALRQVLQRNLKSWIRPDQFQIEDHYANILLLIFVGFVFSGGIPSLIICTFVGLITRYYIYKWIFIRYSRLPNYYTSAMNKRAVLIFKITIILHLGISIWMFGADGIFFSHQDSSWEFTENGIVKNGISLIGLKITTNWYLSILMASIIILMIFYRIISRLVRKVFKKKADQTEKVNENQRKNSEASQSLSQNQDVQQGQWQQVEIKKTQVSLTESYKIQKNPDYFQILAIMKPQDIYATGKLNLLFPFVSYLRSTFRNSKE